MCTEEYGKCAAETTNGQITNPNNSIHTPFDKSRPLFRSGDSKRAARISTKCAKYVVMSHEQISIFRMQRAEVEGFSYLTFLGSELTN